MKVKLSDQDWEKVLEFIRQDPHAYVGKDEEACRHFVEAVKWISRSGAQWRFLPEAYGNWNSIYKRYARWCEKGVWERMLSHFADAPDMENGLLDSYDCTRPSLRGWRTKKEVSKPWGVVAVDLVVKFT